MEATCRHGLPFCNMPAIVQKHQPRFAFLMLLKACRRGSGTGLHGNELITLLITGLR